MPDVQRKLATILATDCVGYSKMMAENEQDTLANIKSCRSIIEKTIQEYGGRVFNTAGDSVIAEFNSPVDCVNAGIDFQNLLDERNQNLDQKTKMLFRVGIHTDDVIIEGDDIFGNGVNIAARLESLCDAGDILISHTVQELIARKLNTITKYIGNKALKNIDGEFPVYRISLGENNEQEVTIPKKVEPIKSSRKIRLFVLPFRNSNNSQDNEDLVDGIVEDIITEFSLIKDIEIMSNAATLALKEDELDINKLKKEFDVDLFLTGSIRSAGARVRISVELLDAEAGSVIWKERYDRIFEDVFEVQDEIVRNVIFSLVGEIELKTLDRAERMPTQNLNSYQCLLRGKVLHHKYQKDTHPEALKFFDQAIQLDPDNGAAYAWKACTVGGGINRGIFEENADLSKDKVREWIGKALEINKNDYECYRMLCRVHLTLYGDHKTAISFGRKAHDLNPNDPRILWGLGVALALSGNGQEGLEHLLKSYELSPRNGVEGSIDNVVSAIIVAYYVNNDYQNTANWFQKLDIPDFRSYLLLISLTLDGMEKENLLQEFRKKFNGMEFKKHIDEFHFKDAQIKEKLYEIADEALTA